MNSIQQAGYRARIWIAIFSLLCLVCCVFIFAAPKCIESIYNTMNIPAGRYTRSINDNGPMPMHKTTCPKGHYLHAASGQCFPCPENTFISEDNHTYQNCMTCKVAEFSPEIQTSPGNTTHSPEFGCRAGYYIEGRRHADRHCPNVECGKCANCSALNLYERLPCSNKSNAKCCHETEMLEPGSLICTSKVTNTTTPANTTSLTKCDRNFYLDKSNNTCQPCPFHTYMDEDNHTSHVCFNNSQVTGQDKLNGSSSMQETSHNDHFVKTIVISCVVVGIVVLLLVVVLICLCKKGKCKAIVGSFGINRGSYKINMVEKSQATLIHMGKQKLVA